MAQIVHLPHDHLSAGVTHAGARFCAGPADAVATKWGAGLGGIGRSVVHSELAKLCSVPHTGQLSLSFWLRPDVENFTGEGSTSDYCYPISKSSNGAHEWAIRYYSHDSGTRPGHLSCYAFNSDGGFGSGARWGATIPVGVWTHVCAVFDIINDTIGLYVGGVLAGSGERIFEYQTTRIYPKAGVSPIHLGGRGSGADYVGGLADVRFFDTALDAQGVADAAALVGT
jgi:hypothetical protein